jgi:hypothetical protein
MVNKDILGGLESAMARGESIQKAKLSFQNAGYKNEEIEEAARALSQSPDILARPVQRKQPMKKMKERSAREPKDRKVHEEERRMSEQQEEEKRQQILEMQTAQRQQILRQQQLQQRQAEMQARLQQQAQSQQRQQQLQQPQRTQQGQVSHYDTYDKGERIITIILIVLLLLLIGILASIFIFKEQLIGFFSDLLS